jgi:hypothetical protein
LIQTGHRAYSQEYHGPYPIEEDKLLFIKDYFNLKPGENAGEPVWNFSLKIPYDKITVFEVYKNAKIQIDMFNHYNVSGDLIEFCIFANGSALSGKEVDDLSKICIEILSEGNRMIRNFSKSDWVEKIIKLRYLWLKPHKDILGLDWHPPKDVYYLANKTNEAARVAKQFEKNLISLIRGLPLDQIIEKVAQVFVERIYRRL